MDNIEADIDVLFDSYFNTLSVMHNSNHKRIIEPSLKLTAATTDVVSQLRKWEILLIKVYYGHMPAKTSIFSCEIRWLTGSRA